MMEELRQALDQFEAGARSIYEWGDRDKVPAARAAIERLFLDARFAPLGDNHHNALLCPYCNPSRVSIEPQFNLVTREEAEDLRYFLDDADMLHMGAGGNERADRMCNLWRRLHLWLLKEQGDTMAATLLRQEFPEFGV